VYLARKLNITPSLIFDFPTVEQKATMVRMTTAPCPSLNLNARLLAHAGHHLCRPGLHPIVDCSYCRTRFVVSTPETMRLWNLV
jgi:hypothetical protein